MGAEVDIRGGPLDDVKPLFPTPPEEARYIVTVVGGAQLHGVTASVGNDVRACAAVCLAAAIAAGPSTLSGVDAIYRGYANFYGRLEALASH
jgi:UDP-N-acetylglucosamine enolpyruvyl transferase